MPLEKRGQPQNEPIVPDPSEKENPLENKLQTSEIPAYIADFVNKVEERGAEFIGAFDKCRKYVLDKVLPVSSGDEKIGSIEAKKRFKEWKQLAEDVKDKIMLFLGHNGKNINELAAMITDNLPEKKEVMEGWINTVGHVLINRVAGDFYAYEAEMKGIIGEYEELESLFRENSDPDIEDLLAEKRKEYLAEHNQYPNLEVRQCFTKLYELDKAFNTRLNSVSEISHQSFDRESLYKLLGVKQEKN